MLFRKKKIAPYTPKYYSQNKKGKISGKWYEKYGTASDWFGVVIGTIVAGFTIALFFLTKDSTDAAVRAANAAENTYREQKRNDSLLSVADSAQAVIDSGERVKNDSINRKRFKLDSTSTQAQIDALNANQKQFEVTNEPYLQANIDTINSIDSINSVLFILNFKNIGNYPVKIKTCRITYMFSYKMPSIKECFEKGYLFSSTYDSENKLVTKDLPLQLPLGFMIPSPLYTDVKLMRTFVFIAGIIKYENLIKKTTKTYEFEMRVIPPVKLIELFVSKNLP